MWGVKKKKKALLQSEADSISIRSPVPPASEPISLIFMDDTTLFSPTKDGPSRKLEVHIELEFCRKKRMCPNTTKSKLMHFTKHKDKQGKQVQVTAAGQTFSTPAASHKGEVVHKHLGFHLDQKLTGTHHLSRMKGANRQRTRALELFGNQDESLALLSVQTRVGPSFCNNMEMVRRNRATEHKMRTR